VTEIANVDMAAAWDGDEGEDWSREWRRFDRSMATYHARLLEAAAISVDDHVLDIGCGNGQTTRDAARRATSGGALGVDLSSKMLARARQQADVEGLTNVRFEQADAQVHPFEPAAASVAISRFGSMFFGDPAAAFTNVASALAPGGRLALVVWQAPERQAWLMAMRTALALGRRLPMPPPNAPGPFGLADADRTRSILESAGFADVAATSIEGDFWLGEDGDDAYAFASRLGMTRGLTAELDDREREQALGNLRAMIDANTATDGVVFGSIAWLVTGRKR
jgi:SAM-dependent methyltransferase